MIARASISKRYYSHTHTHKYPGEQLPCANSCKTKVCLAKYSKASKMEHNWTPRSTFFERKRSFLSKRHSACLKYNIGWKFWMAVSRVLHEKRPTQNVKRIKRTNTFHYAQSIVLLERLQIVSIFCVRLLHFASKSTRQGTMMLMLMMMTTTTI